MAAIHWKSGISGFFDSGTNWSTGTVPGSFDDAVIDATGTYIVTTSLPRTVHSLSTAESATLDITGGEFDIGFFGTSTNAGNIEVQSDFEVFGTFNNTGLVEVVGGLTNPPGHALLQLAGNSTNFGTIEAISGGEITFSLTSRFGAATFTNFGTIGATGDASDIIIDLDGQSPAPFKNSGIIDAGKGSLVWIFTFGGFAPLTNTGQLIADGGHMLIEDVVDGSGTAVISNGGTLELRYAGFAENTSFSPGANGTLVIGFGQYADPVGSAASFTGTLSGFTTGDRIDLPGLQFGADTTLTYTSNNIRTGGLLYVSDGTYSTTITLAGPSYVPDGFHLADDGSGYAVVTFTPPSQPPVILTDRNLVVEMAELANEAYGNNTDPAVTRNWHAVSAAELNLQDSGIIRGVSYTLKNGLYEAAIPAIPGAHAGALVLEGMVNGVKTLTIAFRGTDDFGDVTNWPSAREYFANFAPLILSLNNYIAANGIQQVLATGHSLGGSMAQDLLATNIGIGTDKESGYTWGSPGADLHPTNLHLVNFVHPNDPVANLGHLAGDVRVGTDIILHSPLVSNSLFDRIGGVAHGMNIYFTDTLDLADLTRSSDIFGTRPEGLAIQTGNFWTGYVNSLQVMPGTDHNDNVHISARDKFVLGSAGDDTFHWDIASFNAPPIIIDGGAGVDTLFLPGSSKSWGVVTSEAETNLYFLPTHHLVAELFGVESAHFSDGKISLIPQPLLAANNSANNMVHDSPLVAGALDTPVAGLHGLPNSIHNDGWLFG